MKLLIIAAILILGTSLPAFSIKVKNDIPRNGNMILAGTPWLARMIDKAQLESENKLENLELAYPCPVDKQLLEVLKIDALSFQTIVKESNTDQEIIERLKTKK